MGFPGPGDSALIAAGLLAADGDLSLGVVLVTAFMACLAVERSATGRDRRVAAR
jgi:membrane protein DedA with SNARE-associated domain